MAVDDLGILQEQLPKVFRKGKLPKGWEKSWVIIRVDNPDSLGSPAEDAAKEADIVADFEAELTSGRQPLVSDEHVQTRVQHWQEAPVWLSKSTFAGILIPRPAEGYPPPDALAFYLPFHYYFPKWWGVYLVAEGVRKFWQMLLEMSSGSIEPYIAFKAARLFLYGHEAFHHRVESFATRLEVTHRKPLYVKGFQQYYVRSITSGDCLEEPLACAYGYRKVEDALKGYGNTKEEILKSLRLYLQELKSPYSGALEFLDNTFDKALEELAEENHREALPRLKPMPYALWGSSKHAFTGIARINSRVNYIVHQNHPIAQRRRIHP